MSKPKCSKVRHPTKEAACIAVKRTGKNVQMNVYRCEECQAWHLGHSRKPLRKMYRISQLLDRALAAPPLPSKENQE